MAFAVLTSPRNGEDRAVVARLLFLRHSFPELVVLGEVVLGNPDLKVDDLVARRRFAVFVLVANTFSVDVGRNLRDVLCDPTGVLVLRVLKEVVLVANHDMEHVPRFFDGQRNRIPTKTARRQTHGLRGHNGVFGLLKASTRRLMHNRDGPSKAEVRAELLALALVVGV